jgi:hypothetical protein
MKLNTNKVLFGTLVLFAAWYAYPTQAAKNSGGLRLSQPVETPDGVHFTWTGGATNTTYSLWRKLYIDGSWETIRTGLQGVQGSTDVPGFTLDQDYEYEIRAEIP